MKGLIMSELPSKAPEEQSVNSADMLRTMYTTGADQLFFKKTGQEPIVNGNRTPEAKAYADTLLDPINFEDRTNWQKNANLEMKLSQASNRRLKSFLPDGGNASGHMNESGHDNASGHTRADGSM